MERPLRLLLLEDSTADAELIQSELLRSGFRLLSSRVDTGEAFHSALTRFEPDLVVSDHSVGSFNSRAALRLLQAVRPAIPFIVVAGTFDEQTAVECLRCGADDYVLKSNLRRLAPAVEGALALREGLRRLSPRQLDVLRLVAEGRTTREIAESWSISVKTVETHRTAIMKRLEIHDVVALVRYALRVRLVRPDA